MSIVPASRLSASDLTRLGNNLRHGEQRRLAPSPRRAERRLVAAVNRSLAAVGERIERLDTRPLAAVAVAVADRP